MQWQQIVHQDSYLAGHLAARGWEWWDKATPESEAASVGLTGEQSDTFLAGWNAEIADREQERKTQLVKEYAEIVRSAEKGDPANW